MVRFFIKLAVFVGLAGGCVLAINRVVIRAGAIYKDGAAIVCEQKRIAVRAGVADALPGSNAVLFLGHSRVLAGLVPATFDTVVGQRIRSWNLSLPALSIGPAFFLLRDYLQRNPAPAFIVMQLGVDYGESPGLFDKYACQGAGAREMVSYATHRKDKTVVLNYFFPFLLYREETHRYILKWLSDRQEIIALQQRNTKLVQGMVQDRGYYRIVEQARPSGRLPDDFRSEADGGEEGAQYPDRDSYVSSFFRLAQKRGIRVLLIETPLRAGQLRERTALPLWYRKLLADYPNVRMARGGWRHRFYENCLFADPTHLNRTGAERFTREIADEFVQVFGPCLQSREPKDSAY